MLTVFLNNAVFAAISHSDKNCAFDLPKEDCTFQKPELVIVTNLHAKLSAQVSLRECRKALNISPYLLNCFIYNFLVKSRVETASLFIFLAVLIM
jgi:hypothetical protein